MRQKLMKNLAPAICSLLLGACGGSDEAAAPVQQSAPQDAPARVAREVAVDDPAGKAAYQPCSTCHGVDGGGNTAMNAPSLVSLDGWYVERQLKAFRDGLRGAHAGDQYGAQMRPMAMSLSDETIGVLAAYIGRLPQQAAAATIDGDLAEGRDYYSMICGSCHGPKAEGNAALGAPALAGTDDWYLLRQFENFRNGVRGRAEGDKWGAQMVLMAPALPDEQVARNVIAYINSLAQ